MKLIATSRSGRGDQRVLSVRFILGAVLLAMCFAVQSEQPPPSPSKTSQPTQAKPESGKQSPTVDQRGTAQSPLVVKTLKSDEETKRESEQQQEKATIDRWLVIFTGVLAGVAFLQFIAMLRQEKWMRANVKISEKAANAAKESADAAVIASMPVLSPLIIDGERLHPRERSDIPVAFDARALLVFENYGDTPGIIREVRAKLFLTDMDAFPPFRIDELPIHDYKVIVGGNTRRESARTAAVEVVEPFALSPSELDSLLAEATGNFKRFCLLGLVMYDDFFKMRTTRRFCIKMRLMPQGLFQITRGGWDYNKVTREKIPKGDPFAI